MSEQTELDVVIVGGGLGGLLAAARLARAGRRVRVFEKGQLGGRARSQTEGGYCMNQGPHALYREGRALAELREVGVPIAGGVPGARSFALADGELHPLPTGAMGLLVTKLLAWRSRVEVAALLARLGSASEGQDRMTERAWLDANVSRDDARRLVSALIRVSTYANDPEHQSAGAALAQLARAVRGNVLYVHGGWQSIVEGLRAAAQGAGAELLTGTAVAAIEHERRVLGVRLGDGRFVPAGTVIVATGPGVARALTGDASASLRAFDEAARPVHAACLDVAFDRVPDDRVLFALGFDEPVYFSVHSATARLAPRGGALVHVARYLAPGERVEEGDLERVLDRAQPGWRASVVSRRYLPRMVVSHALAAASTAGTRERPGPAVPEIAGLYVVGDWVGQDGMLADASLASARRAADLIVAARPTDTRRASARTLRSSDGIRPEHP